MSEKTFRHIFLRKTSLKRYFRYKGRIFTTNLTHLRNFGQFTIKIKIRIELLITYWQIMHNISFWKVVIFLPRVDFLFRLPITDRDHRSRLFRSHNWSSIQNLRFSLIVCMQKILTDWDYLVKGLFRFTVSYVR